MRILCVVKNFSNEAKVFLSRIGEADYLDLNQAGLFEKIKDYEVLLVGLGLNVNKELIDEASRLKVIVTATTGLDHIDVVYARERGITVLSLKGETEFLNNITSTAELSFGLLIDLARGISAGTEAVKKYKWEREKFCGHSLSGKTLGIVGYGRLGRMMARYGEAFGMKVIVNEPYAKVEHFKNVEFNELIRSSDFISIHVHLNQETKGMFDFTVFEKMKSEAGLINTSRGEVVDESDLVRALESYLIAGYATDVLAGELVFSKSFFSHPLVEYAKKNDNCIITPHVGGMTHESRSATDIFMARKLSNWFETQLIPKNSVKI